MIYFNVLAPFRFWAPSNKSSFNYSDRMRMPIVVNAVCIGFLSPPTTYVKKKKKKLLLSLQNEMGFPHGLYSVRPIMTQKNRGDHFMSIPTLNALSKFLPCSKTRGEVHVLLRRTTWHTQEHHQPDWTVSRGTRCVTLTSTFGVTGLRFVYEFEVQESNDPYKYLARRRTLE